MHALLGTPEPTERSENAAIPGKSCEGVDVDSDVRRTVRINACTRHSLDANTYSVDAGSMAACCEDIGIM